MPAALDDTDDLFAGDDVIGDGESAQAKNAQVQPEVETAPQSVVNEAQVQQLSQIVSPFFSFLNVFGEQFLSVVDDM